MITPGTKTPLKKTHYIPNKHEDSKHATFYSPNTGGNYHYNVNSDTVYSSMLF